MQTKGTATAAAPPNYVLRMWIFFAGYFIFGGIATPFFPVWLQARGLNEIEIAQVIALPQLVRVFLTPLAGIYADRAPNRRFAAITFTVPAALPIPVRLSGARLLGAAHRHRRALHDLGDGAAAGGGAGADRRPPLRPRLRPHAHGRLGRLHRRQPDQRRAARHLHGGRHLFLPPVRAGAGCGHFVRAAGDARGGQGAR